MNELDFIRGRNQLIPLARMVRSLLVGKGDPMQAHAFAMNQPRWSDTPEVPVLLAKAISDPLSSADDSGGPHKRFGAQIAEALRPLTVFGRLQPYARRVPFNTPVVFSADATEARFVGEATAGSGSSGSSTPVTKLEFSQAGEPNTAQMVLAKLGIIAVHSADLVRRGPPGTDEFIAGELLRSLVAGLDRQFIDPGRTYDAARQAPASVTSGGTVLSSSGSSLADVDSDLGQLIDSLVSYGMDLTTAHWVLSPTTATALARMRGTGGALAYPGIGARGGELLGLPALTSAACAAEGSPGESIIALVQADQVTYADDGGTQVDYSSQAALEMDGAPTGGHQQLRSLWQHGLAAARVYRYMNWQARAGAAAALTNVNF